eukprot:10767761-Alexandrium_andersonii.AAC.1
MARMVTPRKVASTLSLAIASLGSSPWLKLGRAPTSTGRGCGLSTAKGPDKPPKSLDSANS